MNGAAFVLADLSLERPSCYFELGLSETLGVSVYVIATAGTIIHQVKRVADVKFYAGQAEYHAAVLAMLSSFNATTDK